MPWLQNQTDDAVDLLARIYGRIADYGKTLYNDPAYDTLYDAAEQPYRLLLRRGCLKGRRLVPPYCEEETHYATVSRYDLPTHPFLRALEVAVEDNQGVYKVVIAWGRHFGCPCLHVRVWSEEESFRPSAPGWLNTCRTYLSHETQIPEGEISDAGVRAAMQARYEEEDRLREQPLLTDGNESDDRGYVLSMLQGTVSRTGRTTHYCPGDSWTILGKPRLQQDDTFALVLKETVSAFRAEMGEGGARVREQPVDEGAA